MLNYFPDIYHIRILEPVSNPAPTLCLRGILVITPGEEGTRAPHSITGGLASWYMGSGFFGGRCGGFRLFSLSPLTVPAVINYEIFRKYQ